MEPAARVVPIPELSPFDPRVERANREIVRTLEPGARRIAIDTLAGGGTPRPGEALVVVSPRVVAALGVD